MISALESTYCEKKKRLKLDLSWNIDADIPLNYFTAKNKSKKLGDTIDGHTCSKWDISFRINPQLKFSDIFAGVLILPYLTF